MTEDKEFELFCKELKAERAKVFRKFRKAQGWTQAEAAAAFCVHVMTISSWERGKTSYSNFVYRQIYESDWGQSEFNPQGLAEYAKCGVGYDDLTNRARH